MGTSTSIVVRVSPQLRSQLASLAADASSSLSSLIVELIEKGLSCQPIDAEQPIAGAECRVIEIRDEGVEALLAQMQRRLSHLEVHSGTHICCAPNETSFSDSTIASWAAPDPTRRSETPSPYSEPIEFNQESVCTWEHASNCTHERSDAVLRALADFAE
jgi:hypothetical protein